MSFELQLPGLRADNPRDFLAALGLFESLSSLFPKLEPRMAWMENHCSPSIITSSLVPIDWPEIFCEWIRANFLGDNLPDFTKTALKNAMDSEYSSSIFKSLRETIQLNRLIFAPTAKIDLKSNRSLFQNLGERLDLASRIYPSLVSQIHSTEPDAKKRVFAEISFFSMANKQGQKYLLHGVQTIAREYLKVPTLLIALEGEAPTEEGAPTLRLSPQEGRDAAYFGGIPQIRDHPSLNLLAFCGLSFYPVVDMEKHSVTCGTFENQFRWPIWDVPLTIDETRTLLHHPSLMSEKPRVQDLHAIGVKKVWRCRRYEANKSLFFAQATPIF